MKKFLNINGTFLLPDDFTGNKAEALQIEMLEYKDRGLSFETNSYEDSVANFHGYVGLFTSNENKIKIVV